eukprot:6209401-Pleurochrysis_carterae.AAC.2
MTTELLAFGAESRPKSDHRKHCRLAYGAGPSAEWANRMLSESSHSKDCLPTVLQSKSQTPVFLKPSNQYVHMCTRSSLTIKKTCHTDNRTMIHLVALPFSLFLSLFPSFSSQHDEGEGSRTTHNRLVATRAGTGLGHMKIAWPVLRAVTVPFALL